jgi:hypothetical protein
VLYLLILTAWLAINVVIVAACRIAARADQTLFEDGQSLSAIPAYGPPATAGLAASGRALVRGHPASARAQPAHTRLMRPARIGTWAGSASAASHGARRH